ncbi:MAG: hypothetical protein FWC41_09685 [Firmicutes bacterium]|nr:hypothetical protein [Bacillota bacterium]
MKKIIVLLLLVCGLPTVYSQDLIKEIQKLTLANDSLQKQVIKPLQDSIVRITNKHKVELDILTKQIRALENDTANLHKRVKKLDTEDKKFLRKQLEERDSEIKRLKADSTQKAQQIIDFQEATKEKEQQKYTEGQQNIYNQIAQTYNRPFDELIISSTKQSVERDLKLVGNNETARKKLQDLQKYFNAEQILTERYSEQKVKTVQSLIDNIEQSGEVKNLTDKLEKYELCNNGLKTAISKILEIDRKFVANDEYTQETKLQDILSVLSWYFRNYRFNFTDYPYLSDIVLEIMKLKQKDANTDIKHLLNKL